MDPSIYKPPIDRDTCASLLGLVKRMLVQPEVVRYGTGDMPGDFDFPNGTEFVPVMEDLTSARSILYGRYEAILDWGKSWIQKEGKIDARFNFWFEHVKEGDALYFAHQDLLGDALKRLIKENAETFICPRSRKGDVCAYNPLDDI